MTAFTVADNSDPIVTVPVETLQLTAELLDWIGDWFDNAPAAAITGLAVFPCTDRTRARQLVDELYSTAAHLRRLTRNGTRT